MDKHCDIIIPVFNQPELTESCLNSIRMKTRTPHRVIIIDNGSDARTKNLLSRMSEANGNYLIHTNIENLGWVKAVNQGIGLSETGYLCIMNNDTVVETDDWLSRLIGVAETEPEIGLVNPDFGDLRGEIREPRAFTEIDFCRGYCVLIKRPVVDRIGGLDEDYGLGYYDDDDYSVRAIRAGFRCVKASRVTVRHLRDSTFSELFDDQKRRSLHQKNRELFFSKWGKRLRLLFILTGDGFGSGISDLLIDLARRQHIVYLWSPGRKAGRDHINIRWRRRRPILAGINYSASLFINGLKKGPKRYNAVFVDEEGLYSRLARSTKPGTGVYRFDTESDSAKISAIVDSLAKVP